MMKASEIAKLVEGRLEGEDVLVKRPAKIEEAGADEISFIANPKYEQYAESTGAGVLIIANDFSVNSDLSCSLIRVDEPYMAFAAVLGAFQETSTGVKQGIHPTAVIEDTAEVHPTAAIGALVYVGHGAQVGAGVVLHPQVYVGAQVKIGEGTMAYAGVKIYRDCVVGADCILHAGVVVGSDGFGFAPRPDGEYDKVPQTGNVEIGNGVEIGANSCIDRATVGSTRLADGVKIDNLVQLAHNVEIGDHTVIASQAGISGSTKLGRYCMIGGQAGLVGHIELADQVKVNAQAGVSKSIPQRGAALTGSPAGPFRDYYRAQAVFMKLPEMMRRLEQLEAERSSSNS